MRSARAATLIRHDLLLILDDRFLVPHDPALPGQPFIQLFLVANDLALIRDDDAFVRNDLELVLERRVRHCPVVEVKAVLMPGKNCNERHVGTTTSPRSASDRCGYRARPREHPTPPMRRRAARCPSRSAG